jgi:hypothetical protein
MSQSAIEFFKSIPNDVLIEIALYDWNSLEVLCVGYTLDLQLSKKNESSNNRRNVC